MATHWFSSWSRFRLIVSVCWVACVIAGLSTVSPALGDEMTASPIAPLRDQLQKGLRARRPIESQFLDRVVRLVDEKKLTLEFVQGTFNFTQKKYRDRKYKVTMFEQVLRQRAKQEGITALNNVPSTLP